MRNLENAAITFTGGLDNRTIIAHKTIVREINLIRKPPTDMLSVSIYEMRNKGNGGENSVESILPAESPDSKS